MKCTPQKVAWVGAAAPKRVKFVARDNGQQWFHTVDGNKSKHAHILQIKKSYIDFFLRLKIIATGETFVNDRYTRNYEYCSASKLPHMQQYVYSFLGCSSAETLRKNYILGTSESKTARIIQDKMRRSHLCYETSNFTQHSAQGRRRRAAVQTNVLWAQTSHAEQHDAA